MALVKITLEDLPDGKVKIVSEPSMEVLMKRLEKISDLSPAEGYAYHALNTIWKTAKSKDPLKLLLPKVSRSI
jgi:hypothetical protein